MRFAAYTTADIRSEPVRFAGAPLTEFIHMHWSDVIKCIGYRFQQKTPRRQLYVLIGIGTGDRSAARVILVPRPPGGSVLRSAA